MAQNASQRTVWQSVRDHDHDAYLACLFAPAGCRDALMALHAFSIDVARIPEAVSEPMLGEIRLQWWREALENSERGTLTGNPVADALGQAMQDYGLPKPLLLSIIDARNFDLSGEPMPDDQAMNAYLRKSSGNLFTLSARVLDQAAAKDHETLLARAGHLRGLLRLLRLLPAHLALGRFYLPKTRFRDAQADLDALMGGDADDAAKGVLSDLRSEVRSGLAELRYALRDVPPVLRPAFLPLATAPKYLDALEANADNPLGSITDISPLSRFISITRAALRRGRL